MTGKTTCNVKCNFPADALIHKSIEASSVPRPKKFSDALYRAAVYKLIIFLDRTQRRNTKSRFTYTQPRKYVAYSICSDFIRGNKFSATKCANDKDINRENVQRILRDAREAGLCTATNQPTQEGFDRICSTVEEWLYSPEIDELVSTIAAARHMMAMQRDNWE